MTHSRDDGWIAGRIARRLGRRLRYGWRTTPPSARRRWLRTLATGFVALLAAIVALEWLGRSVLAGDGLRAAETELLHWIEDRGLGSFSTAVWIQTLGTDITLVMVVLFTGGVAASKGDALRTASIAASIALLDPVIRLGWTLWDRARPTIILDGLASPGFASFPSGHTAKSAALYGLLAYFWIRASGSTLERAVALILLAGILALIMFGRLRMGVHWPSDVIAGLLLGLFWLAVLILALRRAERTR